jgi:hypothetical protein
MSRSVSVYLDDGDIRMLDRLAKAERRSRSAMVSELIRRHMLPSPPEELDRNPLFRSYTSSQLAGFLREDRKTSAQEIAEYRKLLGLS